MQIARRFAQPRSGFFPVPCKSHTICTGIGYAKGFHHMANNQLLNVMTNQESKLAKKLERRLQEHALQNKNNSYRSQTKPEGLDAMIETPIRIHHHMIQRAQFYTGDA